MSEALRPESSNGHKQAVGGSGAQVETFKYDNGIVRAFAIATVVWGIVGMVAGLLAATQLFFPAANLNLQFITFGRLRPVHTNAVVFAFVGNGMFMGIYYSLQRLCKARMFSDALSWVNFWGWQGIIVSAAVTLPLGFTSSKEYAELEWPIDIAIAVVWVVIITILFFAPAFYPWTTAVDINWSGPVFVLVMAIVFIWYGVSARKWFTGPKMQGGEAALEEIEEEYAEGIIPDEV